MKRTPDTNINAHRLLAVSICIAVLATLLTSNISTLIHQASVHHFRCEAHGDVIHLPADDRVVGQRTNPDKPRSALIHAHVEFSGGGGHTHDICPVSAASERRFSDAAAPLQTAALAEAFAADFSESEEHRRSGPIYLVAPKNSPPIS